MRLNDVIGRWVGRVEVVLAGADEDLRDGEAALAEGDAMRARAAAHRVLARAPNSPLGLALLADACEAGHLDAELVMTLDQLASRAPARAEVWVRLARARLMADGSGAPTRPLDVEEVRDAFARALAVAESGSDARREALLGLSDLDLAEGQWARAELWLERIVDDRAPDIIARRAEACVLRGDAAGAIKLLDQLPESPLDGRAALARGRALAALGDSHAFAPLVRAMVLDVPGSSEALSSALARLPSDVRTRTHARSVVDAKGEQDLTRWRAAFARAEGARDSVRRALREAVEAGDRSAARPLLDAAIEDRDATVLPTALSALVDDEPLMEAARRIDDAIRLGADRDALEALVSVVNPRLTGWADAVVAEIANQWIPASGAPSAWPALLARLTAHAHAAGDLAAVARLGDLAADRSRPVRLAVVGEFNAGKSTFINALIGADVAPTGVVPTTATLHHLRWALDPIAKIIFPQGQEPTERIVALADLRSTLATLREVPIARVEIRMPLSILVRVEILDTPGFNALDQRHADVARAAFDEADIALWLVDGTQAIKQSERVILEEATSAGLPVQTLVNKADRLAPDDLARVLTAVGDALRETRIPSWGPPQALSAKRALAGRLGEAEALRQSGWASIEALLAEIVARSDELKERALRRRTALVVGQLTAAWVERASVDAAAVQAAAARAHAMSQAAARIEGGAEELAGRLAQSLAAHAEAWARDVNLIFVGRDPEAAALDPILARYRVDRAVSALSPALAHALAAVAPEVAAPSSALAPLSRAIVRAAAWAAPSGAESLARAVARAAIATLAEQLFAWSIPPLLSSRSAGVPRELRAFAAALEGARGSR